MPILSISKSPMSRRCQSKIITWMILSLGGRRPLNMHSFNRRCHQCPWQCRWMASPKRLRPTSFSRKARNSVSLSSRLVQPTSIRKSGSFLSYTISGNVARRPAESVRGPHGTRRCCRPLAVFGAVVDGEFVLQARQYCEDHDYRVGNTTLAHLAGRERTQWPTILSESSDCRVWR